MAPAFCLGLLSHGSEFEGSRHGAKNKQPFQGDHDLPVNVQLQKATVGGRTFGRVWENHVPFT